MKDLRDKVVVVTGAASGIGRELAVLAAERGAQLAITDVNEEGLAETAARVEALGARVHTARVDVSDREAVYAHRDEVLLEFGRADMVINNAGVALSDTVQKTSYEDFEWLMGINFWGVVYGTKAYLDHMLERNEGAIVNVSSVFGLMGVPTQSAYNASKFAVRGFTEALRQELDGTNILATSVHPGGIKTNIIRNGRMHVNTLSKRRSLDTFADDFERSARTTAPEAARTILDGVAARQVRVLIGQDAQMIDAMVRLFPTTYDGAIKTATKAIQKLNGK